MNDKMIYNLTTKQISKEERQLGVVSIPSDFQLALNDIMLIDNASEIKEKAIRFIQLGYGC
jgi:hypothetical protein